MGTEKYWAVMFGGSRYGTYSSLEVSEKRAAEIHGEHKALLIPYYDEPHYSTDIVDAWWVVEKLAGEFAVDLYKGTWTAEFVSGPVIYRATADTAPLAICLAALKAVGVEVES